MRRAAPGPLAALLIALAGGCVIGHEAQYEFGMASLRARGEERIPLERAGSDLAVEDERVRIVWRVKDFTLGVTVLNKAGSPAKALWRDASFVDERGGRHSLLVNQPWSDRHGQEVTAIAPGESVEVSLFPSDWLEPLGDPEGRRWNRTRGLFEVPGLQLRDRAEIEARAAPNVGKKIGVVLPIEVGEETYEYGFEFTVESVGSRAVRDVI